MTCNRNEVNVVNNKSLPLYENIFLKLEKAIENGDFKPGEMLPTEVELQEEFGVSRITVRRSLLELELKGYVEKKHGVGTFVLQQRTYSNLVGAMGFTQETIKSGEIPSSIILGFKKVPTPDIVAEFLQLDKNSEVYYLKRLRLKNGRIVGMNETFISDKFELGLKDDSVTKDTSLYELYEKKGIHIGRATETMEAVMPSESLRDELFISDKEPVFKRERITYSTENEPIEYSINNYRSHEYKYIVELRR